MATIGSLVAHLTMNSGAFTSELTKSANQVSNFQRNTEKHASATSRAFGGITRSVTTLKAGLAALGVAAAARQFSRMVTAAVDTADALGKTSARIGVTVEELQQLRFAAERTGSSASGLDNALQQFTRRLGDAQEGTGKLGTILEENNISLRDAAGAVRPVNDLLLDFADIVAGAESAQERARLTQEAFGRGGQDLINILASGSAGIRAYAKEASELGLITSDNAEAAARANDALTDLSRAWSTTLNTALLAAAPALEAVATGLTDLIKWFRQLSPELQPFVLGAAALAVSLPLIIAPLGLMVAGIAALASPVVLGAAAIGTLVAGLVVFREEISGAVLDALQGIQDAFVGLKDGALGAVVALVEGVQEWLGSRLTAAFDLVTAPIARTVDLFKGMYEAVVGGSYVPDMVDGIGVQFRRLDRVMVQPVESAVMAANVAFAKLAIQPFATARVDLRDPEGTFAAAVRRLLGLPEPVPA